MKLNHRQLEAFRAMIETGSVTEAASRIGVTQPAASRLLSDFEYQIGYPLFTREKKRLIPTSEALALFEEVDRSFIGINAIAEAAREIGTFRLGSLHIAGMPALALEFLPRVIAGFMTDKPDISVALQIHSSQKVMQCVASQQFDIGFAEVNMTHSAVVADALFETPMRAALPPQHPLCAKSRIVAGDFDGEAFVSLGSNYPARQRIDAVFMAENVNRKLNVETQLSFALGHMVARGLGVSVIDPITAEHLEGLGLIVTRPFEPEIPYTYQMVFPRHKPRSQLCRAFVEEVKTRLGELSY